ncbi:MAG: DNA polymerase I [Alphaproteobacteria bacterium]|nr:DNA polymerase I [Alphaproteobacteria bacterium]
MADSETLYLVDGSGFIFRAYYALPQTLTNPKGEPVGAVLGFCNMLHKLLSDFHAGSVAVIFDAARKNFRYDLYSEYKANRAETPEDLIPQFPYFRKATEAFGIPALEVEGYEADDLIAAYARLAKEQGKKIVIVGSDKDLFQLLNDHVSMYDPLKQKYIGEAEVREKFGVGPEKVIEVQALIGDSTDNIPGVPGIGPKTAAELINTFGDVETLLSRTAEIKQEKRRSTIEQHAGEARLSKKLVTLDANAPVPLAIKDMKAREKETTPELIAFLQEMGFHSLLKRLNVAPDVIPAQAGIQAGSDKKMDARLRGHDDAKEIPISQNVYTLINEEKVLKEWIAEAYETGILCIDTETTSLTPAKAKLVGISLASIPGRAAYIPVGHTQETDLLGGGKATIPQLPLDKVTALLKPLLEDESVLKIAHNAKYDWQMFAKQGIHMQPVDDTMLISYVLDGTSHAHGMDYLSETLLQHKPIPYEEVAGKGKNQITFDKVPMDKALAYAAEDADVTLRLHKILKPRLAREKMVSVYENIERPMIITIAEMELAGIKIDPKFLKDMSTEFGKKLYTLEGEIHKLARTEFNIQSPKQVGVVLFEQMGLEGGRKTGKGEYSTAVDVLEKLAEQGHEIVKKILEHRQLAKLKSTYTDALQEEINPATGRVHTSFSMAHTSTGRLASSDPNLQNIPIRTEEGRKIREAFVAEPGHVLLSVDYSQVELRLAAALAGVEALKHAFKDKKDIHAITASQVFGIPLEQITPEIRRQAKAVNFGIIYGISGFGLAKQLGTSNSEASEFIRKYLARFKELQDFMEKAKEEAREHGFVKTYFGRKCFIPGIRDKNPSFRSGAERQAINAPLQGTAADIMKIAMGRLPGAMKDACLKAKMLLQVHDELVFEVPESELEKTKALVKSIMENVVDLGVPLDVEAGAGPSWGKAH